MDLAPSIFISHGSPMEAVEWGQYQENLRKFAKEIGKPEAIVSVSAHWQYYQPVLITSNAIQNTIHDFYGFPEQLYLLKYEAPGNPSLAHRISEILTNSGIETRLTDEWGLDHGTWVPLRIMFPEADIPVLQISIPIPRSSKDLNIIGRVLYQLRKEKIMLMGSGGITHNLRLAMQNVMMNKPNVKPDNWAEEFDSWIKERLEEGKFEDILHAQKHPLFNVAAPTTEHFDPVHFILGSLDSKEGIRQIHEEIKFGNLSMRSFASES
ncbi:MAG: dioxygenase [Methanobacteriota archaeon]|nr:MAG: dioxygenase [Euryarchaeota archaeon]